MNIPAIKLGAFQMDPKKHNWIFLENILNDFDKILVVYGDICLSKTAGVVSSGQYWNSSNAPNVKFQFS
jgi:hypothetical protein